MNDNFFKFLGIAKKSGNLIKGYNKCEEMIKKSCIILIILSKECSNNTKKKFENYCIKYNVHLIKDIPKEKISLALGESELNVVGIKDKNIGNKLISLHKEYNN